MVFESIVADLLNRFLGDYVDNLDSSQLNIGIWGGDIKLDNLEVKETALDDLDLPVKLKYGYLSSLILKIPWKNLYNEPVIATIDGLNLIVVPNKGVVYNAEKAKKNLEDLKQKTLARLEEARKNRRKAADPAADSFSEKMITQIIKNLQITVSNIHVRFEDKYTNRHRPFVTGVTLQRLDFQTTDSNWKPTIHKETVKLIHKLVSLENLAMYWNTTSELISDLQDKAEIRKRLQASIHTGHKAPDGFKYILEPIKMEAKLVLNQKPETDGSNWSIPKIDLSVDMKVLALAIGKYQYQDILLFLEAQERFQMASQYLKYRPNLNEYKGHYKTWWKFAYTSILEEKVRRRRHNWSWERMRTHRRLVRQYRDMWVRRQTEKSLSHDVTSVIKKAEETLDVFNLNVARQQAEMEIDRKGLTRIEDQAQGWVSWGKSWFGGGGAGGGQAAANAKRPEGDLAKKFEEAMTPEEKAKLFEAIDYQENIPPTNYPKEYVENKFDFRLGQVGVTVEGAVTLQLLHLGAAVKQRPSANAMKLVLRQLDQGNLIPVFYRCFTAVHTGSKTPVIRLQAGIQELRMDGCGAEMLRVRDPSKPWLSVMVDTKPLNEQYDQKVQLAIAPVTLKYHAPAVNNAIEVFKPPDSVKLNQLTALAMSRYEEVKARSVTGLAHAVEKKSKLVLDIQIQPATVLITEGGVYKEDIPTLVADLGLLSVNTVEPDKTKVHKDKLHALMDQAYDRFRVKLSNVVITLGETVSKARDATRLPESPLHLLKPTGLDIQIHKSSVDDLRLPKMRVVGDLPDIVVAISDKRLLMLMRLMLSIPKPKEDAEMVVVDDAPPATTTIKAKDRARMKTIMEAEEIDDETQMSEKTGSSAAGEKQKTSEQQVQIELDLKLKQIGLIVLRGDVVLCDLSILRMASTLQMRTFDMVIHAEVGAVRISLPTYHALGDSSRSLCLIDNAESDGALMQLKFVQANPESPFFATEYHKTEQSVDFKFSRLNVSLHQQGLMELKRFSEEITTEMNKLQKAQMDKLEDTIEQGARKLSRQLSGSVMSLAVSTKESQSTLAAEKRKARKQKAMKDADPSTINMRVDASVGALAVLMGTDRGLETVMQIKEVKANVEMTMKKMVVTASLQAITMEDRTPTALYRNLLAVYGDHEMLRFNMVQYNRTDQEKKEMTPTDIDMSVKLRLAQMRFVFLNLWLCRMMAWIAPFQEEATKAAAAAQAASEKAAAEAAQNVKQILETSPPRIELDVELQAPVLILPRLSTSTDVLVFCFGYLMVKNKLHGHKDFPKAIIDNMDVRLADVTFGIGRMDEAVKDLASTCEILKKLSFTINVHRNIAFGMEKGVPEIVVDATIPAIEMNMSDMDYTTLMQTLTGNLAEGKEHEPPAVTVVVEHPSADDTAEVKAEKKIDLPVSSKKSTVVTPTPKDTPAAAVASTRILFQFTLGKILAVLYTGVAVSGTERDAKDAFACMKLDGLKLSGSIKEDNAMDVSMSLTSFTMSDERKEKTKIRQLMDKKKGHEQAQFLALSFKQNALQDKIVMLKMSAFFLCLCPEFLGCLARFFTVPASDEEKEKEVLLTAKAQTSTTTAQSSAVEKTTSPAHVPTLALDCDMQGVEVVLVENSQDPVNSQALILSFNVGMVANPSAKTTTMKGGVKKLTVFSSYYALERRNEITYQVLQPVDIGVELTVENDTNAKDILLTMSHMQIRMSPSIIRLLSSVNAEFAKSAAVDTAGLSKKIKMRTYPGYWENKNIDQKKFWFFDALPAEEALDAADAKETDSQGSTADAFKGPVENARVEIAGIKLVLEAGNDLLPTPLIFMDMEVTASASGWSSALQADAALTLQMSYYNESFSVWEPVIEPVEVGDNVWEKWNLKMAVKGRNKLNPDDKRALTDVKIDADKMLNVTITKSFLLLLNNLSEVFEQAAKQDSPPQGRQLPGISPFVILNETGLLIRVADSDTIKVAGPVGTSIEATHGDFVDLHLKNAPSTDIANMSLSHNTMAQEEMMADLRLEILDTVREVKIARAEKRAVSLPKRGDGGQQWKLVAETTVENGRRLVTLSSHIRVENHLDVEMELYSKRDTTLDLFGTVPVGGQIPLAVPLLYTPTGEIYFKPANDKCEVSYESLTWLNFDAEPTKRDKIRCNFSNDETKGFYFETVLTRDKIVDGGDDDTYAYTIHLYHPLHFHNILPMEARIDVPMNKTLQPGDDVQLNIIPGHKLRLSVTHLGEEYCLDMRIPEEKKDLDVVALNTATGSAELLLGIHWTHEHGDQNAYLYAPFWLVNNTGMKLKHVADADNVISHAPDTNPIVLPFPSIDLAKKKKARVQVDGASGWSDEFPLDTVGNAARIVCKGPDRDYELTVDIKLCQSGLTKIVSFAPFYLVSNLARLDMEVREEGQKEWTKVPADRCVGVWPVQRSSKKKLYVSRFSGYPSESLLFPITENMESLAEMAGDSVGVQVSVSTCESSSAIHLQEFQPGAAPVCVMNALKDPVSFGQKGHRKLTIGKNQMAYFTWNSLVDPRVLELEAGDWKGTDTLDKNRFEQAQLNKNVRRFVYVVNFLAGRQRTILFTDDIDIGQAAYGSWETDMVDTQAEISLQGIGVSVVDNIAAREILYMGVSSSSILWEEQVKKNRFKPMTVKNMEELEEIYQNHLVDPKNDYQPWGDFQVSMKNMIVKRKKGKETKIRRIFEQGIWMNYGKSAQRTRLHFKLNHLQIDNQLDACVFPRVLAVVPPPKSVVVDNAPKPFVELSLLQRQPEYSSIPEIEYAHVLVQEFAVQVDQGLLNALMQLVASQVNKKPYDKEMYEADRAMALRPLEDTAQAYKSQRPKSFYDDLHISPLMIHLSFSQGGGGTGVMPIQSEFINVFIKSVGVSFTELQDVVFKLAYFERKGVFYSPDQLNAEIINHYTSQAIKQLYVLVFGLDIIGNPFGLVRDLSAGVEDLFYQPFQGAIQGPEEFAAGVALGVQSMFGHAVGGAAGAVGRITGTVGKGVAALTFDQDYQRKRQEDLNRRPQSFGEGMARGMKGLGMGVVDGITGVVTKPIEGVKQEGAKGLFKGVGKGLVGVVTRPVSGVVDFASCTLDSVKTVAGGNRGTAALRPPRVIRIDRIIRPYSAQEALGFKIFKDTDRGALAETDEFITYAPITNKIVLLITDCQLLLSKRTDVMGTWVTDWQTEYEKINEPQFVPGGIKLVLKEKKRGFLGIGSSEGKIITFQNSDAIQQKVLAAYRTAVSR